VWAVGGSGDVLLGFGGGYAACAVEAVEDVFGVVGVHSRAVVGDLQQRRPGPSSQEDADLGVLGGVGAHVGQ
jgi:NAD(P)H-hydrate repair Nnr-like enzyme with NAD(P)H-hydrate dehydratase domain